MFVSTLVEEEFLLSIHAVHPFLLAFKIVKPLCTLFSMLFCIYVHVSVRQSGSCLPLPFFWMENV